MFKIVSIGNFISKKYFTCDITPKRCVAFYEIELYKQGTGTTFINNSKYQHTNNMFIFAKPGDIRFTIGNFECLAIHFTCSDYETRNLLNSLSSFSYLASEQADYVKNIIEFEIGHTISELKAHQDIFNILSSVFGENNAHSDAIESQKTVIPHYEAVMKAKDYIDNHYSQQISMSCIAKDTFLSPNFLRERFSQIIGISPHRYLNEIRISKACKLLSTTKISLSDVAGECGFQSQSYMNYAFKKEFHITPLEYRKTGK